jgi:hypothetical protein
LIAVTLPREPDQQSPRILSRGVSYGLLKGQVRPSGPAAAATEGLHLGSGLGTLGHGSRSEESGEESKNSSGRREASGVTHREYSCHVRNDCPSDPIVTEVEPS